MQHRTSCDETRAVATTEPNSDSVSTRDRQATRSQQQTCRQETAAHPKHELRENLLTHRSATQNTRQATTKHRQLYHKSAAAN